MTIVFMILALISMFAEVFKIWKIDVILCYYRMIVMVDELEDSTLKTIMKNACEDVAFGTPSLMISMVADAIYTLFTYMLLMTRHWYVGLFIIMMTFIQHRFFKYQKKAMIVDSIMCTLLLLVYIISL